MTVGDIILISISIAGIGGWITVCFIHLVAIIVG